MASKKRAQFVINLLKHHTNLKIDFIKKLILDSENRKLIDRAFTLIEIDPIENQETLEFMGDAAFSHWLTKYTFERFPWLKTDSKGVKTAARIKIVYGGKVFMSEISESLGILELLDLPQELEFPRVRIIDALEDTFEALCHVLEQIVDLASEKEGFGFYILSQILTSLFNKYDISTKVKDLVDPKTLLKEQEDKNPDLKIRYLTLYNPDQEVNISSLFINNHRVADAVHEMKKEAEKLVAKKGLEYLKVDLDALDD